MSHRCNKNEKKSSLRHSITGSDNGIEYYNTLIIVYINVTPDNLTDG
jgi:hypothetical protein